MAPDLNALAETVSTSIKKYVADRFKAFEATLMQALDIKINQLPAPKDGRDATPIDIDKVVELVSAKVPKPRDGKDAEPVDFEKVVATVAGKMPAAKDGKDADVDAIAARVLESVKALIPTPKDGKDAPVVDVEKIKFDVLAAIPKPKDGSNGKDAPAVDLEKVLSDVLKRIPQPKDGKDAPAVDVEKIKAEVLAAIPKARDGKDADPIHMHGLISTEVALAVAKLPPSKNGKDAEPVDVAKIVSAVLEKVPTPKDGKDAEPAAIESAVARAVGALPKPDMATLVRSEVAQAMKSLPPPQPGKDGVNYDPLALQASVQLEVREAVSKIEPVPGKDANAAEIAAEVFERVMRTIPPPKDGRSVTVEEVKPLLEGEVSRWELEFERRAMDLLQRAVDRMPKPKDGRDGFDDLDLELDDDGRTLMVSLRGQGGRHVTKGIKLGTLIDRGVFKAGSYERGDGVTYGGSFWIAQKDTSGTPGSSPDWRLAVKRGRDGKESAE